MKNLIALLPFLRRRESILLIPTKNQGQMDFHLRRSNNKVTRIYWVMTILLVLSVSACSRQTNSSDKHIITVKPQSFANTLFYSGTIKPYKTVVIPSPADGVLVEMPFQYGEHVKEGQLLFLLSSSKFVTDYKSALMQYIKAKSDFNNSESQLKEAEFLHKNQLISDDDYKTKQSNFYGNRLALLQAKDALEILIRQLDIKDVNLYNLTIADIDKINEALHLQANSDNNLRIISPAAGVVLSAGKGEEDNKKLAKGDVVKQGDVLAIVGDMGGISVSIKVNELTVNRLKVGQKVKITGIAFPDDVLNGEIKRIDRQGESASGGLPVFSVEVAAPKLTQKQQRDIHVGMSAKVEISIEEDPQIMLPMGAISEKNGESFVKRYDEKNDKIFEVVVRTGKTTMDSVAILSGVKLGDKIVIPN